MKRILVPTDFSGNAENALYYAIEMAKREHAILIPFHAYQINDDASDSIENIRKITGEQVKKKLQGIGTIIEHAGGIKYEFHLSEGKIVDSILKAVSDTNADLVIMGTKGESNIESEIFGSTTANLINKAECPVIAVPEGSGFRAIKKITYATNYKDSDISALKKVIEIAAPYQAQVNILHISAERESVEKEKLTMENFMNRVNKLIPYNNLSFQLLSAANIENELQEYIESGATDLLVLSTHHRGIWDKIFGASITASMAGNSFVPVMAFHYNRESAVKIFS